MQSLNAAFFYWLFVVGEKYLGSGSKFNCAIRLGSGHNLGYGPGSGFNFKPVQTSRRAVSDPLPEPPAIKLFPHLS